MYAYLALDRQIDQLVYELYGLSEAEIALVEAATSPPPAPEPDAAPAESPRSRRAQARPTKRRADFWEGT